MAKKSYMLIKMLSSANTGYYYILRKATRNAANKWNFMKFDPIVNTHVLFNEHKLKKKK